MTQPVAAFKGSYTGLSLAQVQAIIGEGTVYTCASTDSVGDAVYLSTADTVALANSGAEATMPAIGLISEKVTSTTCRVRGYGDLSGLSGFTADREYFISTSGSTGSTLTLTAPTTDGQVVQSVGFSRNTTTFVCRFSTYRVLL